MYSKYYVAALVGFIIPYFTNSYIEMFFYALGYAIISTIFERTFLKPKQLDPNVVKEIKEYQHQEMMQDIKDGKYTNVYNDRRYLEE